MLGFWGKIKKPIMALAPMADVTDAAFRRLIAKYSKTASLPDGAQHEGGPDVMFTEFVSADGLSLADARGKARLMKDLLFSNAERPIVAQFFSSKPEMIEAAARLARELGFDGVDINMGCPDRSIERQGAGAALIKNPELAAELIRAAKRGAGGLPVSVKTRVGYSTVELDTWIPALLQTGLAALTIHARTRKELSLVPARWEHVRETVALRDKLGVRTLILGNGDLADLKDARRKVQESGADGAMLGRAIFGNPFLFSAAGKKKRPEERSDEGLPKSVIPAQAGIQNTSQKEMIRRKLSVALEHTILFDKLLGNVKNFSVMKKHYKAYISGWDGARELRARLMETKGAEEAEGILLKYSS